jgi:hypothetical protein
MLTTKHNWLILSSVSVISLLILLSQATVFAQWQGPPDNPPEGNIEFNFLENPMTENLDLAGYDVVDVGTLTTDQLVITVGTLDITSPPALSGEEEWAFGATAGKSMVNNSYTYGVYAKTLPNSGGNPSYAVYGISNNNGGVGVLGVGNSGWAGYFRGPVGIEGKTKIRAGGEGIIEVGGSSTEANGEGSMAFGFYSTVDGRFSTAIGYGLGITDTALRSMALGNTINVGGDYSLGIGLDAIEREVTADNVLSIMGGNVGINVLDPSKRLQIDGSASIQNGYLWAENTGPKTAIMGVAEYGENSVGVQAYGNTGVFAAGETLGLYAYGYYGALAQGATVSSYIPPDPDDPFGPPVDDGAMPITLFGINSALADVGSYDPYTVGLVTTGGFSGGGLGAAGLGLCAISGANAYDLDQASDTDYYSYCQDLNGKNNYAGFFDGDIYVRDGDLHTEDGSVQLSDRLLNSNQNLIYGNAINAVNGTHLIKLQYAGNDKFKVDRNGIGYFSGALTADSLTLEKDGLVMSDESAFIDFAGGGDEGPSCKAGSEGILYYFSNYNALCVCRGVNGWTNLIPGEPGGKCTNGFYNEP